MQQIMKYLMFLDCLGSKKYLRYSWLMLFVFLHQSCNKNKSDTPEPIQECLPTLSVSLATLEMAGDTLIVNYQVSGSGNYAVDEIIVTTPDGLETISTPGIPYDRQVIFVDAPPESFESADLVAVGKVTSQGIIETAISYQIKIERDGNKYSSGGLIRDKCQIN